MTMERSGTGSSVPLVVPASDEAPEEKRREQCPFRSRNRTCELINSALGWRHGVDLEDCDRCWEAGGPDSSGGSTVRKAIVDEQVRSWKQPHKIARASRPVLIGLTINHMTPEERSKLLGDRQASFNFRSEEEWERVKPTWKKALSLGKSLLSKAWKPVSKETHEERHISCFGTTPQGIYVQPPCPSLSKSRHAGRHYCNACGCGDQPLALLDSKITYPHLECPRQRPGFSNALPDPQ